MGIQVYPAIPKEFDIEVSRGVLTGSYDGINVNGEGGGVNTLNVQQDVWPYAGDHTWLTAASTLQVVSSSANDTAAGTGARSITITGLDINLATISETVTFNGTTPVTTVNSYFRLLRGFIGATGTYANTNLGNITITATTGGSVQGYIAIGHGRLSQGAYTVPAGRRFILKRVIVGSEATKPTNFHIYIQGSLPVTAPYGGKQVGLNYPAVSGMFQEDLYHETILPAGTDLWIAATTSTSNTNLYGAFQGVLVI